MERHREPNVTDTMLNKVDTGCTSSLPKKNQTFKGVIIGVVLVSLVIVIVAMAERDTNTSQTNSEQIEALDYKCDNENTSREEEKTDQNTSTQLATCVYKTSTAFLEKLSKDPFGDKCISSSNYVQCKCNRENFSTQNCESCEKDGLKFPEFCFCDNTSHCENNYDDPKKKGCNNCLDYFQRSPYKERGNCSCSQTLFMNPRSCSCHEGFSNLMCSSIEKRICKSRSEKKKEISSCIESNDETCVLKGCDGDEFICELFNEGNKDLRKNADTCKIINLKSTECIWTKRITTEQGRDNKEAPADTILGNNSDTCEQIFANVLIHAFLCAMFC